MRKARQMREEKGMSLRDVEQRIGVDHSSIAKFELGRGLLREAHLYAYADLLEARIDELLSPIEEKAHV